MNGLIGKLRDACRGQRGGLAARELNTNIVSLVYYCIVLHTGFALLFGGM